LPSDAAGPIFFEAHEISCELEQVNLAGIIDPSSSAMDGQGSLKVGLLRFGANATMSGWPMAALIAANILSARPKRDFARALEGVEFLSLLLWIEHFVDLEIDQLDVEFIGEADSRHSPSRSG